MVAEASNPLLEAALGYAARGWPVFPLHTPTKDGGCSCNRNCGRDRGKHPRTLHGLSDATTDVGKLHQWWGMWPEANIGVRTGAESGLMVVDVDRRNGGDESLAELPGQIPASLESITGGGRHILLRHPGSGVRSGSEVLGPGIDIKGDGGYIVAPPSLHASGKRYRWEDPAAEIAACPSWLLAAVTRRPQAVSSEELAGPILEGRRNSTLASIAGAMRRKGSTVREINAALSVANADRCSPPLSEEEISKIARSVGRYEPEQAPAEASPPGPVALVYVSDALRKHAASPPLVPVPTGLTQLDALLDGGLRSKRLHVLCGPPGAGKTALVGEIARRIRPHVPVLICSTEIEEDEQSARMVAPLMGTSADAILRHQADPMKAALLADGWPVALLNLDADEPETAPLTLITLHIDALVKAHGVRPVVILDYMQDLVTFDPEQRRLGVSSMARKLRQLARLNDIPMLACSSVSRAHYGGGSKAKSGDEPEQEDPRAWLAAAKESGDVEFAGAVIMYLETSPSEPGADSPARLIVAKARMGKVGFVGLRFDGQRGAFHESSEALRSMGAAARDGEDEAKVVAAVQRCRPKPKPWREMRDNTGVPAARADRARTRLMDAGRLVERRVVVDGDRRYVRRWVVLPEWLSDALPIGFEDAVAAGKED